MKITLKRSGAAVATLLAGSIALTGCSNSNDSSSSNEGGSDRQLEQASGELTGEGASSQQNAMENVFGPAFSQTGATLAYNATGSGAGQTQFVAGQVDFAGSDSPLKEDQVEKAAKRCQGNEAWHLPMVIGPVAVAYHLNGVDSLNLSSATIAKIFKGEIKKWNDPAIAAENSGAQLPDKEIKVVYRSDESGTSDNFQKYLKASAPEVWDSEGKAFPTAVGAGANGSTGVADEAASADGAITYVESGFAKQKPELKMAKIDFGAGPTELNKDTVNNALAKAQFKGDGNNLVVDSKALYGIKEKDSYPLALTTYEIVCSKGYDGDKGKLVKNMMFTILDNQNDKLEEAGYIPVKGEFKDKLEKAIEALQ
ncbi:phosphate ABC transporter substrate-binding protein PstS [Corynebacterium heidelbergense]|uniref:Phosphate-binding protein n=1 Tax=Corynebacterium heidelbergense TaxID=2055947 RepID=A0A364VA28_9CORY|nr:phosphate ABC transporter substrate-binding protein PstS [Corynebacterium heidelbergense]RAV33495.1 phosphate ABC transporter substrate-binding protein PstS [Corynebacterium heidelbergense]WCZ35960.1 Phosphate-binding protein PstS 2 precursor [Corynebacterium heidelbergense]